MSSIQLTSDQQISVSQLLSMSNRHGLVSGATGTGKTVTLQLLAEGFSKQGVPVFTADVKGDLSGLAKAGTPHKKITERIETLGLKDYSPKAFPVVFWDIFSEKNNGQKGHPIRTTISEMGPLLLAYLLDLNDTQEGVLSACFKIADDEGWLLLDLKDLRSLLHYIGDNASDLSSEYGLLPKQSVAAIQRDLLALEQQGADYFFGEPAISLHDFMRVDFSGRGVISLLDATELMHIHPKLYSCFLLWLLSELFEQLPEVGDSEKPKLVLFFDEAHLLFDQASKPLLQKMEQVVRLVRSKGVGIYFVTQNPSDVPESVLGQLGLRIQHALRAFTPKDRKVIRAVADNFRPNPPLDVEAAVTTLGVGEALVSCLDEAGVPMPVVRGLVCPPESRMGTLTELERHECLDRSPIKGKYDQVLDRESAYEFLQARAAKELKEADDARSDKPHKKSSGSKRQSMFEAMMKSGLRAIGSQLGRQLVRGIFGSLLKK